MSAVLQEAPQAFHHIDVRPLTGVLGAEIHGVDLSQPLDQAVFDDIVVALRDYLVIYFPDQDITHDQHIAFSRRFGSHMRVPQLHSVEGHEDLQRIQRLAADTGRIVGENWHTDSTWMERPPAAVMMRALEVPAFGGDTGFMSMYAAYEALSPTLQQTLERLNGVHSATRVFGTAYHKGDGKKFDASNARQDIDAQLGDRECVHPLVCRHAITGRKFLYVNRVYVQRIDGMTEAESRPLLEFLYEHTARFEFTCRVRWKPHQLLIWDNRASMHKAISDYPGKFRSLVRTTIAGDRPA